jgi:DNA repair exonuclease SbcCD nuclease subunit
MATLAKVADIHVKYPCPTFAIAGNHDMNKNDPDSIPKQPLGVLFNSNVMTRLSEKYFEDGSLRVRVVGVEYDTGMDDGLLQDAVKKNGDADVTIAVVHALASFAPEEKIQSMFNETVFDYRDLVFDGCPDVYIFGHYHKDQGIMEHLGVKFVNLGAISRGSLTLENLERKPKISLIKINSQGIDVQEHIVPHVEGLHVFDVEKKKKVDAERRSLVEFISQLQSGAQDLNDGGVGRRLEEFKKLDVSNDIKIMVEETLEMVEQSVDD